LRDRLEKGWLSLVLGGLVLAYYLPMIWGWHSVPFHLLGAKYTGSQCTRRLPEDLRHLPGNDATGVVMDYPNEYYTAQRVRRGDLPWWNPDIGTGRPWIGNAQVHPFSPLLLPFVAWPTPWTYTLQFLLGSVVCLSGARRLLALLGAEPLAAALGAALWTWNPYSCSSVIMSSVWAYWWFPWALAGIVLALRDDRPAGWVLASVAGALMVLSGQPETALFLAEMAGVFALFLAFRRGRAASKPGRWLAGLGLGLALCLLLSASQWYPILEVLRDSEWYKSAGPEHARALTHPIGDSFKPGALVFLLPVSLASWALLLKRGSRWSAAAWGAALAFCLAFSLPGVALSWPFRLLRLDGIVPPLHAAELACVPAAALAALGFSAVLQKARDPLPRTLGVLACALGMLFLALGLWLSGLKGSAAGVSAAWLVAGTLSFCLAALLPAGRWTAALVLASALFAATYPLAAQRFLYPYFSGCPQPDWRALAGPKDAALDRDDPPTRIWAHVSPNTGAPYLMPNLGLLSGACDLRSSLVLNPPGSSRFSHAWGPGGYLSHLTYGFGAATPDLLAFLGVERALLSTPDSPAGFKVLSLQNGPRAFLAHRVEFFPDEEACLARFKELLAQGRLGEVAVVLETPLGGTKGSTLAPPAGPAAKVTWLGYDAERLALEVQTPTTCLLVVTEAFSPRWEAVVDGIHTPVVRANVMFRGVSLEPGSHRVEMRYRKTGMGVSVAVSAVAWLSLAVSAWRKRRRA
jgi:hypothetical protein